MRVFIRGIQYREGHPASVGRLNAVPVGFVSVKLGLKFIGNRILVWCFLKYAQLAMDSEPYVGSK